MSRLIVLSPVCSLMSATCDSGTSAPELDVSKQIADRLGAVAVLPETHRDVVMPLADEHLADGDAADPGLDQVGDVADIDAVARGRFAVDLTTICGSGGN